MMNADGAAECLRDPKGRLPSEVGQAVDVLYGVHGTYRAISERLDLPVSDSFLSMRHHIFRLPNGVRRQVDEGVLSVTQGYHVARLKSKEDQWMLAIVAVEKNLTATECKRVTNMVSRQKWPIQQALATLTGVRFDEISPPVLLLPISVDFWFELSKVAWERGQGWQDACYQMIRLGVSVDFDKVATQLDEIAKSLREESRLRC